MRTQEEITIEKLARKLEKKVGQTLRDHEMIREGDRVLAGISGGKDSFILLEALSRRRKAMPFGFDLTAIHIEPLTTGYHIDKQFLQEFCDSLSVPLVLRSIDPDLEHTDKNPCFVCSWHRRKALFDYSREENYNLLALGHHRDDAVQTMLMNMLYHGSISSLPYKLSMFEGRMMLIRPLMDTWEKDILEYAELRGLKKEIKSCRYEKETKRSYVSELLQEMEDEYPKAKINMFRAMGNIYEEYLPKLPKKTKS